MNELDPVVLRVPLPEHGLIPGDVGTIVHRHAPDAWEVEFVTGGGATIAVTTLRGEDIRPIGAGDLHHVRQRAG